VSVLRKPRTCKRCGNAYGNTEAFVSRCGVICRWCGTDGTKPRKRTVQQVLHEAERTYEMPNAVRGALRLATMTLEEIAREISKTREEHRLAVEIRTAQLLGALGISCDYTGERR